LQTLNSRGVSEMVVVVLLVLVGIVAVALVFIYINNAAQVLSLSPEKCVNSQISPSLRLVGVCYDSLSSSLVVSVSRVGIDQVVGDLLFSVDFPAETLSWTCGSRGYSCSSCSVPEVGESVDYWIDISSYDDVPSQLSLSSDGCFIDSKSVKGC